ncbi:hypothetical protein ACTTAI_08645 [Rhodobacter capsulatus]|uniref:hypothetical protein n=1 Tax=Rhodobacter capsulatus TaxID=1061 RepID=UPI004025934A
MKYTYGIYSNDSFKLLVPVLRNGDAMPLTGAAIEAVASCGSVGVAATIIMQDAAAGLIGVVFPAGALAVGVWQLHVRVRIGGETQTVLTAAITVAKAAEVAP